MSITKSVYSATICCYDAVDMDDILIGCKGKQEMLCLQEEGCCAANAESYPVGVIKEDNMLLKLGLPCCTCGLKVPEVLILGESHFLCCKRAAAFPFKDPVPSAMCTICFFSILPEMGLFKPPPGGGAPAVSEMER